jgi:hypothetical protein
LIGLNPIFKACFGVDFGVKKGCLKEVFIVDEASNDKGFLIFLREKIGGF